MNELEAKEFLESLSIWETSQSDVTLYDYDDEEDYKYKIIRKNEDIIRECDNLLLDRLRNGDSSLRVSDINQVKGEAFKENQQLRGLDNSNINLIPTQINVQIINNN